MKAIRHFWSFDHREDKAVRFLAIPLIVILLGVASALLEHRLGIPAYYSDMIGRFMMIYLLILAVIIDLRFDQYRFGGTFTSKSTWLEYLKTSPRGKSYYRDVLCGSQILRPVFLILVAGLLQGTRMMAGAHVAEPFVSPLVCIAGAYLASQIGCLFTRVIANDTLAYGIATCVSVILTSITHLSVMFEVSTSLPAVLICCAALALSVLLSVLMVWMGMKKKENEYVDR